MGNDAGKVVAVIVAIAVVIGGVAFFTMSNDDEESTANNTTSQQDNMQEEATVGDQTIVELAQATPDLSTLVDAVVAADLAATLSGEGPFTVFAPTNAAFAALPEGTLEDLLRPENKDQLTSILTFHVVAGSAMSGDLADGQKITTVQGDELTVAISESGEVTINGAKVVTADIQASNGVVHVIDAVLLPQ
jgi:uncharacterized surface protein with fasciclin (FAS1) repeats